MRVIYLTHFDLLRPTTNRISDIRFCEGFAENECEVEMITPYVHRQYNIRRASILEAYGIEHPFRISMLPTPLWEGASKWIYTPALVALAFPAYLRALLRGRSRSADTYVLSRDVNLLIPILWWNEFVLRGRGPKVVHWAHEIKPESAQYRWVYDRVDGIIGTNSAIIEDLHAQVGTPRDRLAITLNPVSTRQLRQRRECDPEKRALRQKLGLPEEGPLVVYTGKLGPGMDEIQYLLEAAVQLPDYTFALTGGKPRAVEHYHAYCRDRGIQNVAFTGFLDNYTDVMDYQVAADVLVSYYTRQNHLVDYNYPQKVTEYMLSGNPIVTPDFRATRDVLNRENAIFVAPEDPTSLTEGIRRAVEDRPYAARIARRASQDARDLTFQKRTALLMSFFETL